MTVPPVNLLPRRPTPQGPKTMPLHPALSPSRPPAGGSPVAVLVTAVPISFFRAQSSRQPPRTKTFRSTRLVPPEWAWSGYGSL
ncbi:hypothetical protein Micbo1qcDRAFT_169354, partial [Microdochium bolleyi]